jgi:hypothetical protein
MDGGYQGKGFAIFYGLCDKADYASKMLAVQDNRLRVVDNDSKLIDYYNLHTETDRLASEAEQMKRVREKVSAGRSH